jgi:hypothetical protein
MKVVVIVLVVIALLFVALVVVGTGKPDGGPRDAAASTSVDRLRDLLIGPADEVEARELESWCVDGPRIVISAGSCAIRIAASGLPIRELPLTISEGIATISMSQPGQIRIPERVIPEDGDGKASFSVFKEGGTLSIACSSITPCVLEVGEDA